MQWLLLLPVVVVVLYMGWVVLLAWWQYRKAPREEMLWCPKHGMIRKEHVLRFLEAEVCPRCFRERMMSAEKTRYQMAQSKSKVSQ